MFICPANDEDIGVRNAHVGPPILGKIQSKTQINHGYILHQNFRPILHQLMLGTESDVEYHARPIRRTEAAWEGIHFPRPNLNFTNLQSLIMILITDSCILISPPTSLKAWKNRRFRRCTRTEVLAPFRVIPPRFTSALKLNGKVSVQAYIARAKVDSFGKRLYTKLCTFILARSHPAGLPYKSWIHEQKYGSNPVVDKTAFTKWCSTDQRPWTDPFAQQHGFFLNNRGIK